MIEKEKKTHKKKQLCLDVSKQLWQADILVTHTHTHTHTHTEHKSFVPLARNYLPFLWKISGINSYLKRFGKKQISLNRRWNNVYCSRLAVFIYDHRAAIKALIHTAAGEQNEKQEDGKLQDAVFRLLY